MKYSLKLILIEVINILNDPACDIYIIFYYYRKRVVDIRRDMIEIFEALY